MGVQDACPAVGSFVVYVRVLDGCGDLPSKVDRPTVRAAFFSVCAYVGSDKETVALLMWSTRDAVNGAPSHPTRSVAQKCAMGISSAF